MYMYRHSYIHKYTQQNLTINQCTIKICYSYSLTIMKSTRAYTVGNCEVLYIYSLMNMYMYTRMHYIRTFVYVYIGRGVCGGLGVGV